MQESNALPIADSKKRILAFVIDDIVVSLFFLIIFYDQITAYLQAIPLDQQADTQLVLEAMNQFIAAQLMPLLGLKVIYHTVLVWQNGMTLGKYLMKIRVVSLLDNEKPLFMTALSRAMLRIPSEVFMYLGFLMAFFTPLSQTFHDKFSNCVVIDV